MDEEAVVNFREYLATLRRHKGLILAVVGVLAAITIAVAIGLPPAYRSSATILIEEQDVSPDLVRSAITSFADERISVISQQVMTSAVLLELARKYGLFEKGVSDDDIVEQMRKDIKLTTVDASVSDRSSGRRVNATIAFKISYESRHADRAQKVVNDVVTFYLEENARARQQSVSETTAFLTQEADRLGKQIQDIEARLAEFKRRNVGRTPESSAVNMQLSERTQSELQRVERDLNTIQERRISLESQLSLVSPSAPIATPAGTAGTAAERSLAPAERLRSLQAQYVTSSAIYGADHPDIRRMQREIAALKAETGTAGAASGNAEKLKGLETELVALKERYAEDHPDVQRLRRSIAALNAPEAKGAAAPRAAPDNPAYVSLVTQIESAKREFTHLIAQRDELRAKQRIYDSRLLQIPEIEREFRDLTRDYENSQRRYSDIKAKQLQAEGARELERDRKGERFSLGEPANLPLKPNSPNRLVIALAGLAASLAVGLGLAFLLDAINPAIKGPWEVSRISAPVPILTAIPYIETSGERQSERWRTLRVGSAVSVIAVAVAFGVHSYLKFKFW